MLRRAMETVYNHFNRWIKSGVVNIFFNRLLSSLDAHGPVGWSATELNSSNIRPLRNTFGVKIILILPEITAWAALTVVWHQNTFGNRLNGLPLNIVLNLG
jgi:putative transposase